MKFRSSLSGILAMTIVFFAQNTHASYVEYASASAGTYGGVYASDIATPTALATIDASNYASATIKIGGIGAGISTDTSTSSNNATASWLDSWSASSGAQASGLYIAGFKAEGSFSPGLSDAIRNQNVGSNFGGWFELRFDYKLGEINGNPAEVYVDLWTDGGSNVNNISAWWLQSVGGAAQSLVPDIVWGTNALGNTTFSINVHPFGGYFIGLGSPCPSFPCTIGESMDVSMALDGTGGLAAGTAVMADFLHTFTVDVQSTDPNALWTSDRGRLIGAVGPGGNQIPEPQTVLLFSLGVGLIGWRSRRGHAKLRR